MEVALRYSSYNSIAETGLLWRKPASSSTTKLTSQFWSKRSFQKLVAKQQRQQRRCQRLPCLTVDARLFGPAIFEASKLKVLFLGDDHDKHPEKSPRTYTLTHSDITAKLTLAISREINKAQIMGWYSKLQRDEVLAEWKKTKGEMSLHVHCHISGGHWLLDAIAPLRFYIFRKELPVVLEAFRHGDRPLFENHPELEKAHVWVYFHSNVPEYNKVECWGPLEDAAKTGSESATRAIQEAMDEIERPWHTCTGPCDCCSKHCLIPVPDSLLALALPDLSVQKYILDSDSCMFIGPSRPYPTKLSGCRSTSNVRSHNQIWKFHLLLDKIRARLQGQSSPIPPGWLLRPIHGGGVAHR